MSSSQTSSFSSEVGTLPPSLMPFADVPCRVEVVLGKGTMTLRTCLSLRKGSIVKLIQAAGQDLELIVNGVGLGRGEVVIIDDSVSVRLTEVRRTAGDAR